MDPFVVYGDMYKTLRESISGAMYSNQLEELSQTTQVVRILKILMSKL